MNDDATRFWRDLNRLLPDDLSGPLALAVSGGADSMAMLWLAHAAMPGRVIAATVDHGLRPESAAEAAAVARWCAGAGVSHTTLRLGPERSVVAGNLQDWARRVRYWCLGEWASTQGAHWIATAHHQDDVAEGFLLRAARGAGLNGLAAMPATRRNDGPGYRTTLVRPLLEWRHADLVAVVTAAGIAAAADPSNADPRFDRARMRRLLAAQADLAPPRLARAATNLRDAAAAIDWIVDREQKCRIKLDSDYVVWLEAGGLPFEIKRRLVILAIDQARLENRLLGEWRKTAVGRLVTLLDAGRGGTVADIAAGVRKGRWRFAPAPPRRAR